jgi:outer membrane protein assembly factor BamB
MHTRRTRFLASSRCSLVAATTSLVLFAVSCAEFGAENSTTDIESGEARLTASELLFSFENGSTDQWTAQGQRGGPWSVAEWAADGGASLKADVDLAPNAPYTLLRGVALNADLLNNGKRLFATVKRSTWGNFGAAFTAKLYVKTSPGYQWRDGGSKPVTATGTELSLDLTNLDPASIIELGVEFNTAQGAQGRAAIYLDNVRVLRDNEPPNTGWTLPGTLFEGRNGRHYIARYGASTENLSGVQLASGRKLWTATTGGQVQADCAYADALVYTAGNHVFGLDASTGRTLYDTAIPDFRSDDYISLACPAAGGSVYLLGGTGHDTLVAVDIKTGKQRWTAQNAGFVSYANASRVLVGRPYYEEDTLIALDAATGTRVWSLPGEGSTYGVTEQGGQVYSVINGSLARLNLESGYIPWSMSLGDTYIGVKAYEGRLYAYSTSQVAELDPNTGMPRWTYPSIPGTGYSSFHFSRPGRIVANSWDPLETVELDPRPLTDESRRVLARRPEVWAYATDELGDLFRISMNRELQRVDPKTDAALWSYPVRVFGSLLHADQHTVYFTDLLVGPQVRTRVLAVSRATGQLVFDKNLQASATFVTADARHLYFSTLSPETGDRSIAIVKPQP